MPSVVLVRAASDAGIATRLSQALEARGFGVRTTEPGTTVSLESIRSPPVIVLPHEAPTGALYAEFNTYFRALGERMRQAVVVARVDDDPWTGATSFRPYDVVRTAAPRLNEDAVVGSLVSTLLLPQARPWLNVSVRPSMIHSPVGVTWWERELFVADESLGHVVRLYAAGDNLVTPGLDEPFHIHADRSKLLVANRVAHEIIMADVNKPGGLSSNHRTLTAAAGRAFARPHGVHQAYGCTVVADTDNHRVVATLEDIWLVREPRWHEIAADIAVTYPCAVLSSAHGIWIADTFNDRLILASREGDVRSIIPGSSDGEGFDRPVALATDTEQRILIVSEECCKRVRFLRIHTEGRLETLASLAQQETRPEGADLAVMGTPMGLSVNRDNILAIADRERRCVWTIDLDEMPDLQ